MKRKKKKRKEIGKVILTDQRRIVEIAFFAFSFFLSFFFFLRRICGVVANSFDRSNGEFLRYGVS